MNRRHVARALAIGGIVAVAGCSFHLGLGTQGGVDREQLESGVKAKLEAAVNAEAKSVTCPDTLDAEVNATTRCTLQAMDGTKIGVTVTVTSVDGDRISYAVQADQKPTR